MQLITTRNKEISFAELKKAISSGNGLELIRPGDKFAIELKNGELVNAVCGGYVNEKRARFVLEDSLAEKWRMNDTPTNKGGYAAFHRNSKKDSESEGKEAGTMLTEIGYIKGGIDRIERKQDAQDARYISMAERMSAVESSAKSAHHRIDRLEGREVREDG